jgi:hypothetical protein
MEYRLVIYTLIIMFALTSCVNSDVPSNQNVDQVNGDTFFCEQDSDCVMQEDTCCGHPVNKETYEEKDSSELVPRCNSQCLPDNFNSVYCNQDNACSIKTNCDDCDQINNFMEQSGCNQNPRPVQISDVCSRLDECGCTLE